MVAHSNGEVFDGLDGPDGRAAADADRSGGAVFRLERRFPRIGPGSWSMIGSGLSRPGPRTPTARHLRATARGRHLERADQGHRPPRRPGRLARPPEPLGRRVRLRDRPPHPVRTRRLASRRDRRGGRRLVLDPGLLPPGHDRRHALRGRGRLVHLEPRHPLATRRPTSSSASTRPPRSTRRGHGTRRTGSPTSSAARPDAYSAARRSCCAPRAPRSS